MVHLLPHWNWDNPELVIGNVMDEEGQIPCSFLLRKCYSVELIVDGNHKGSRPLPKKTTAGPTKKGATNPDELYLGKWLVLMVPE